MARNSLAEMTLIQRNKGNGVNVESENIPDFIKSSYSIKPDTLYMKELTWKFLVRNALRGKNILLVGMRGSAKTMAAHALGSALKRPFFNIPLGSTQDPRSAIIGNTHYQKDKGTYFQPSYFVQAIQTPNAVILLDELSRAHPEAWNLLMPVLDYTQRYLRLEETEDGATVPVAEGVSFIATANVGNEYTATRVLDLALLDRFTIVEIETLMQEEEASLLKKLFPSLDERMIKALSSISSATRTEMNTEQSKLTNCISTRVSVETAGLMVDGFSLEEAAEVSIYPFFPNDGGNDSERTYVKQMVQKYIVDEPVAAAPEPVANDDDLLFTQAEIDAATP